MAAPPNPRSRLWIDALVLLMLAVALALSFTQEPAGQARMRWDRRIAERPPMPRLR